jgi:hypothetical protein
LSLLAMFANLRLVEHLGIDAQGATRRMELGPVRITRPEVVFDPRRGFGAVAHRQHHRRRGVIVRLPRFQRLAPVGPQQRVGFLDDLRQRLVWLGSPVIQILGDLGLAVQVIQLAAVGLRVRQRVVADYHARRLHQAGLDRVVQAEVGDHPLEQGRLGAGLAGRCERRRRQVEAATDAAHLVNAVQPLDPARGLFQVDAERLRLLFADLALGRLAVGVMGLVVDDDDVLVAGEPSEHSAHIGFVTLRALLHHRAVLLLQRHQAMPVLDQDLDLIKLLPQGFIRAQREGVVVVLRMSRQQHLQPLLDRQARRDDEHRP